MICTHITDTIALTFRDWVIARIVVESWTLWRGLRSAHGDGVVGGWGWPAVGWKLVLWRGLLTVHGSMVLGLWVDVVDLLRMKASPLERPTFRPWWCVCGWGWPAVAESWSSGYVYLPFMVMGLGVRLTSCWVRAGHSGETYLQSMVMR